MIATNVPATPSLRIVVLCAGFSTRLGRPKALARVHGRTLLQITCRTVANLTAGKIIVVLPPRATRLSAAIRHPRIEIVECRHRGLGLSASVRCGLNRARYAAAALLLPVDLAHLERRDLERLIARWRAGRRRVVGRRLGGLPASPLILPRRLFAHAKRVAGDRGLRDWLSAAGGPASRQIDLRSASLDVDTRGDLRRARSWRRC